MAGARQEWEPFSLVDSSGGQKETPTKTRKEVRRETMVYCNDGDSPHRSNCVGGSIHGPLAGWLGHGGVGHRSVRSVRRCGRHSWRNRARGRLAVLNNRQVAREHPATTTMTPTHKTTMMRHRTRHGPKQLRRKQKEKGGVEPSV